jgi:hypothetical protein
MLAFIITLLVPLVVFSAPTKFKALELNNSGPSLAINEQGKIEFLGWMKNTYLRHQGVSATQIIKVGGNACYLKSDGSFDCANYDETPEYANNLPKFKQLTSAMVHTVCGLDNSNFVYCFDTGNGGKTIKSPNTRFKNLVHNSNPYDFPCGISKDDELICWGFDSIHDTTKREKHIKFYEEVKKTYPDSIDLAVLEANYGAAHGCAINSEGELKCWGWISERAPQDLRFKMIESYNDKYAICGITTNDKLVCWGSNSIGETPYDHELSKENVKSFTYDTDRTCILNYENEIKCAGYSTGYMGAVRSQENGSFLFENGRIFSFNLWGNYSEFLAFYNLARYVSPIRLLSSNGYNSCALYNDNVLSCDFSKHKIKITKAIESMKLLKNGLCLISPTKEAFCLIYSDGIKRLGSNEDDYEFLGKIDEIEVTEDFTCSTSLSKKLSCAGSRHISNIPKNVGETVKLSGDREQVCALNTRNELFCWGKQSRGDSLVIPSFTTDVKDFAFNRESLCIVSNLGSFKCWKANGSEPKILLKRPEFLKDPVIEISIGSHLTKKPSIIIKTETGDYWIFSNLHSEGRFSELWRQIQ